MWLEFRGTFRAQCARCHARRSTDRRRVPHGVFQRRGTAIPPAHAGKRQVMQCILLPSLPPPPARQHLSPLIINAARRVVLHFHVALLLPQRGFEVILELTLTSNAAASYLNTLIELNGFARKRTGLRIVLTRYAIELSRIAHNYAGERRESAAD